MASPQTDNGFLRIANELADAFGRHRLRGNAWLILWQIIRYSYGYNKAEADISRRHLAARTGLSARHVERELTHLLKCNIITASAPGKFSLNKNYDQWLQPTPKRESPEPRTYIATPHPILEPPPDSIVGTDTSNNGGAPDSNNGALERHKDNLQKLNRKTGRSAPSPHPDHKTAIAYWCTEYEAAFGHKYVFSGSLEAKLIKQLLAQHGLDFLKQLMLCLINTDDNFLRTKRGITLKTLKGEEMKLVQQIRGTNGKQTCSGDELKQYAALTKH